MDRKMKADRVQQGSETGDVSMPVGWERVELGWQRQLAQPSAAAAMACVAWIATLAEHTGAEAELRVAGGLVTVTILGEDSPGRGEIELAGWIEHRAG